jgi:hypothetical protein
VQIHHIDDDPSNNVEENLAVVCNNHHSDAHTKRALAQNLTPDALKALKKRWEEEVAQASSLAMTPSANLEQAIWTYVNHQRLPDLMKNLGIKFRKDRLSFLTEAKVVDKFGIPVLKEIVQPPDRLVTIYDSFDWANSRRLHSLFIDAVDEIILRSHPLELGAIWTKREILALVKPGSICFCLRGFRFKRGRIENHEEEREVYAEAHGIAVRLTVNTRHMYGSSALYDAFTGHRSAAILFIARNVAKEVDEESGKERLVIRGTPIAMGMGFVYDYYQSPYKLRYGWAKLSAGILARRSADEESE